VPTVATDGVLTAADLADRMVALQPLVAARARRAEEQRRLDDEVLAAIHASGVFRHFVPRCYGGLQLGVVDFVEIVLPLGEADASTAWVTSFLMEHNLILSLFPERTQDEVFGSQPYVMAPGAAFPPGRAVPVEGGFLVSGRWSYASGVRHSDWAMGTVLVDGAERPDMRWVLVPIEAVEVHDVWDVDGMAATGSDDFSMEAVFVPDHRTLRMSEMADGTSPGARLHGPDPTYALPMTPFLAMTAALPIAGAARGALRLFIERLEARVSTGTKQSERASLHVVLGDVSAQVHIAELLVREAAVEMVELARAGRSADIPARAAMRSRIAHAAMLCREAVRTMVDAGGSSLHLLDNPLQRAARDITVASAHVIHDRLMTSELHGRVLLGLPPQTFLV
jgi:3-hydroxy-9,10-secoandrosta-1,3,5(10)-triene-9,17-dione monooxygenase